MLELKTALNFKSQTRLPEIDLFRVLAIFFVMLIHSNTEASEPSIWFFKIFLGNGSVPAFFILSGYLGLSKIQSTMRFVVFLSDKFKTLAIPYLFWNILTLFLVFIILIFAKEKIPSGNGVYLGLDLSFSSLISALLGIGRMPIVYQFWFLRDLFLALIFSYFILRYLPFWQFFIPFCFLIPFPFGNSLGFFLVGCFLKAYNLPQLLMTIKIAILFCCCWIILGIGSTLEIVKLPVLVVSFGSATFLWFICKLILASTERMSKIGIWIASLGSATFFVYAVHEPTQTVLFKAWQAFGLPGQGSFLLFIGIPLVVFTGSATSYYALRRLAPSLMSVATGSR